MSQVIEPSNVSSEFPHASFVSHPHLKRSVVLPLEHAESTLSFAFPHAHIQNGFAAEPTDRKGINLSPEVQSRDQPTEGNTQALPQGPDAASNIPVTTSKAVSGAFSTLRWLLRFIFAPFVRAVDAVSRSERPGNIEHGILFALLDMLRRKGQGSMYTVVNTTTLGYLADLLRMDDYATIPTRTTGSDTFNLLQFIIHVRETGSLDQAGLPNAERKMLYLIIELGTIAEVISKSLQFDLSDLTAENLELVASGASADVFAGVCRGDRIALKRFRKFAQHQKDFCREVFTWQALKHEYVLPFVGVNFRQSEPLTIVSPFMENGTLISWRNKTKPAVYDIDERILEVAGGLRYLHSEGIVHGDLRGVRTISSLSDHNHAQQNTI
ncbi:hypothetical protein AX15_001949 [Amanita polypyramis BW_CC]|nr:hypothetical protein AX15_001949 [Amanita polypyramis BW_CC]